MPFLFYDPTWIILLPAIILSIWASANVKSTFGKYSRMYNRFGLTGADAARKILDMNGLYDVRIERISGELTDNYDPRTNVVHLSESTCADTDEQSAQKLADAISEKHSDIDVSVVKGGQPVYYYMIAAE